MGGGSSLVRLGKAGVWVYVVETAGGLRLRLSLDEWEGTGLHPGQRVPVRQTGKRDESLFFAEAVAVPPLVWLVMLGAAAPRRCGGHRRERAGTLGFCRAVLAFAALAVS